MSQFRLKKVSIQNWMTIRSQELEFPDSGLVFVTGLDMSNVFDSISTGKTALGDALCVALLGAVGRYSDTKMYSRNEKGDTLVTVTGTLGQQPLQVELGYKYKKLSASGEGLRFTHGESVVMRSHVNLTRQELSSTLGVSQELAPWSVYVNGDRLKFGDLSHSSAVSLLMDALGQPPWDEHHKRAKATLTTLETEVKTKTAERKVLTELHAAKTAETATLLARMAQEEAKHEQLASAWADEAVRTEVAITTLVAGMAERDKTGAQIRAQIKAIEHELADENKKLETEDLALRAQLARIQHARKPIGLKQQTLAVNLGTVQQKLKTLKSKPRACPTCKKPWDQGPSEADIEALENEIEQLLDQKKPVDDELAAHNTTESEIHTQLSELFQKKTAIMAGNTVRQLSTQLDALAQKARADDVKHMQLAAQLKQLKNGPPRDGVIKLQDMVAFNNQALQEYTAKIGAVDTELQEVTELVGSVKYWTQAFAPSGIPNMVLTQTVPTLNSVSKALAHKFSKGVLDLTYETSRELTSGETSNKLHIRVRNSKGATRLEGNSKGESGIANLLVAETLTTVGRVANRIGFRWYDEVITSQDSKVRHSILAHMQDVAHTQNLLVFVVDHHPEINQYADYVLQARKDRDGVTTYHWI